MGWGLFVLVLVLSVLYSYYYPYCNYGYYYTSVCNSSYYNSAYYYGQPAQYQLTVTLTLLVCLVRLLVGVHITPEPAPHSLLRT